MVVENKKFSDKKRRRANERRNFHSDIEKLRNIPIKIDSWAYNQVGVRNDGIFKDDYQKLEVRECGEKLIDIGEIGLLSEDYYFKKFFGRKRIFTKKIITRKVFLRKSHAERLARADKYFRKRGLFLQIVSGWRHPKLQKIIKEDYAKRFGQKKADRMFASVDRKVPAPHSTGASFDVELKSFFANEKIEMNVNFNNENICSLYWAEELFFNKKLDKSSEDAVKNRRILYHGLCSGGVIFEDEEDLFVAHPGEYWHYGDGDTLSAYLKKESFIRYGVVCPFIN